MVQFSIEPIPEKLVTMECVLSDFVRLKDAVCILSPLPSCLPPRIEVIVVTINTVVARRG